MYQRVFFCHPLSLIGVKLVNHCASSFVLFISLIIIGKSWCNVFVYPYDRQGNVKVAFRHNMLRSTLLISTTYCAKNRL